MFKDLDVGGFYVGKTVKGQVSFEMFRKDKNIKKGNGVVIGKLGIGKCFKLSEISKDKSK